MSRFLYRLAHSSVRHRALVILTWLAVLVGTVAAAAALPGSTSDGFSIPGTESQRAIDLLEDRFPAQAGSSATVVFSAGESTVTQAEQAAIVTETLDEIARLPQVIAVSDPLADGTVSADGTVAASEVRYAVSADDVDDGSVELLFDTVDTARVQGLVVELRGDVVNAYQQSESHLAEIVGLAVAVVVLLLVFGSAIAAALPIVAGLLGVGVSLAGIDVATRWLDVNEFGPTLAIMIGLAVGIDYSLFIVSRHRAQLAGGMDVAESIARSVATAGGAVVFAGITVMVAISGLTVVNIPILTSMGLSAAASVAVAVLLAVTLLPALLGVAGRRLDALRVPFVGGRRGASDQEGKETLSARWAHRVTGRPRRWLAVGLVVMGVVAIPTTQMRLGIPDDGSLPESRTERRAYDLSANAFGPGSNGPFTVVVDVAELGEGEDDTAVADVEAALAEVEGIVAVTPPSSNEAADTAVLAAIPETGPSDDRTADTLRDARAAVGAAADMSGAEVSLTGTTAINIDASDRLTAAFPAFLAVIVGLTLLLLVVVFRSLLVPLKAAVAILISIVGAFGVVVAIFQWGWLAGLIGLEETTPLVAFLPVIMFAILFGLSMDYEVFILSRIREEWVRTGSPQASVDRGIAATARVITAAALIMMAVFASFVLTEDPVTKMFGVGLTVAVLLDATVVRMILVPATMVLLGRAAWWLPRHLDRTLPDVDVEGARLHPPPAPSSIDAELAVPDRRHEGSGAGGDERTQRAASSSRR